MLVRISVLFLIFSVWLDAAFELALPFTDHAVIQAGEKVPVWGSADPGEEVRVQLGERTRTTKATKNGAWKVEFEAFEVSARGIPLVVTSNGKSLVRKDLVFGEVWIATGQSNMRWMLKDCATGKEVIANGKDDGLRVLNFQGSLHPGGKRYPREFLKNLNPANYYQSKGWQRASPDSLAGFSGVGYFFARKLRAELGVPVGIIHLAVGGSPMEAHLPQLAFEGDEQLKGLLNQWWKNPEYPRWCRQRAALNLTHWLKNPVKGRTPPHPFAPAFLWEAGVEPLLPFPVKGVLWYQGESNATEDGGRGLAVEKEVNRRKFASLIKSWRRAWSKENLPVYFVQLPGLNRDWELFREMQLEVSREVPGVGMAVTIDVGHPTNVHPPSKKPVGERLARLALAGTYGKKLVSSSPVMKAMEFAGETAVVFFDQKVTVPPGETAKGFEVAGEDRVFHPAIARVDGKSVILRSSKVSTIVAVRYAWADDPNCNVTNGEGLPLGPFRSDDWPVPSFSVKKKSGDGQN